LDHADLICCAPAARRRRRSTRWSPPRPQIQWRQIAALDAAGTTATYSGARTRPDMSEVAAQDACSIGNNLANARATPAMLLAFQADPMARWRSAWFAPRSRPGCGRERAPAASAHLLVTERHSFPLIDLPRRLARSSGRRTARAVDPVCTLANEFVTRAIDPDNPSIR